MKDERLLRAAMEWVPPEKKKRGRPPRTWGEGIKKAMSDRGLTEEQTNNRGEWRRNLGNGR